MKIILHLCADIGSDSRYYQLDEGYTVIKVGEDVGVENFTPPDNVHGVIANPVCTEFSTAKGFHKENNIDAGMFLVNHCMRIIEQSKPVWWLLENPAMGKLKDVIGKPAHVYQPWEYGSPYTKKTALWGSFNIPKPLYDKWNDVPKNERLYLRPTRGKPSLAFMHKSAIEFMPEFEWAKPYIKSDADFRSLCSDGFAREFYRANP
jgi:hypothetical protein